MASHNTLDGTRRTGMLPGSATFRWGVITLAGIVGLTAVAGGALMVFGPADAVFMPPVDLLAGTVFRSFVIPGSLLAVVVGGTQILAAALAVIRSRWTMLALTLASLALLVWIFVETVMIPWSALQAVYFAVGLGEIGLVLIGLGLLTTRRQR
ncbi:hypothetical protein [Curtobacterium pusillum]|uniref:hypothetical protein n=1 Tax=Curtobacterium pusillum TaxID=69373 RepID=UPI0021B6524C|nr:hypothetical protein [Curtobacterium pusillum]